MNDARIIEGIIARDKQSLLRFYRIYTPTLRIFIRSRIAKAEDAEEVLQDTLFAFLEALRDFRGKSSIKTFLYSIARNKVVDYYRRKKLRHLVFSQAPQVETLASKIGNPEDLYDEKVLRKKINTSFARILPKHKHILVLKYLEDMSVSDIARSLSISFKSAESRLFRARKAFVEAFVSE